MCKLIISVKGKDITQEGIQETNDLMDIQWTTLKTQKDGCGAFIVNEDGSFEVKRSLGDYQSVMDWLVSKRDNAKIAAIHTRMCTSGGVSEDNVHFFQDRGIYIAHNGWLEGRAGYKYNSAESEPNDEYLKCSKQLDYVLEKLNQCKDCKWYEETEVFTCRNHQTESIRVYKIIDKMNEIEAKIFDKKLYLKDGVVKEEVDTMEFLKSIERPLSKESIAKAVKLKSFQGVALMYDTNTKKAWIVSEKKIVYTAIREDYSCATLFSFDPTLEATFVKEKSPFGLSFYTRNTIKLMNKSDLDELEEGVFELDYGYKKPKK